MISCKGISLTTIWKPIRITKRFLSRSNRLEAKLSNSEVRSRRNQLFETELTRQKSLITRVEKIKVELKGAPEECTLIMNKGISTPANCALHVNKLLLDRVGLALVNGRPWDMTRPLEEDCQLQFLHFQDRDPHLINKAFWRSGCYLLGLLADTVFKDEFLVELHSWPAPDVSSGSFVYDVDLKMESWQPSKEELRVMSGAGSRLAVQDLKFERLNVDVNVALDIFRDNRYKLNQIPEIAGQPFSGNKITLYRVGDHVDISRGPMIYSTKLFSNLAVTAVHHLDTMFGKFYRFQGIGLPKQLKVNHVVIKVLHERAAKLNPAKAPFTPREPEPKTPTFTSDTQQNTVLQPANV